MQRPATIARRRLLAGAAAGFAVCGALAGAQSAWASPAAGVHAMDGRLRTRLLAGNGPAVRALLRAGVDPNGADTAGDTPLVLAVVHAGEPMVADLLAAGADPNVRTRRGSSPLLFAAFLGRADICRALLARHADPNARDARGYTPLLGSVIRGSAEIVKALLDAGADPNLADGKGDTPLRYAARDSRVDLIGLLLSAGAEVNRKNEGGITAILQTAIRDDAATTRYLAEHGADPNIADNIGRLPLPIAVHDGQSDLVGVLLAAHADPNKIGATEALASTSRARVRQRLFDAPPCLALAMRIRRSDIARLLLSAGADANLTDRRGRTPLAIAIGQGWDPMVELLLDSGVDPSARMRDGRTPLMLAASDGRAGVVALLIRHGADVNATADGMTAVGYARRAHHAYIAGLLKKAGADR